MAGEDMHFDAAAIGETDAHELRVSPEVLRRPRLAGVPSKR